MGRTPTPGPPSAKVGALIRGSSEAPSRVSKEDSLNDALYSFKALSIATALVIACQRVGREGIPRCQGCKRLFRSIYPFFRVSRTSCAISHPRHRSFASAMRLTLLNKWPLLNVAHPPRVQRHSDITSSMATSVRTARWSTADGFGARRSGGQHGIAVELVGGPRAPRCSVRARRHHPVCRGGRR